MNIDKLRNIYKSLQQKTAETAQKIQEQEQRISVLKEEREAAAETGDYETYEKISNDIQKAENMLYVMVKQSANQERINPEQVKKAWIEFSGERKTSMAKKLKAYDSDRHKLCNEYEDLLREQNDTLSIREELAAMIGVEPKALEMDFLPSGVVQNFPRNARFTTPEAYFFLTSGEWSHKGGYGPGAFPGYDVCHSILELHKPVQDPDFGH